ncbi:MULTISPECIES: hypothetical protein [Pantoea]|uniref:Uncharacterized protein n=1 Tax=Pantoea brenneri TaxID=472694 RepID=A0ABU9MUJ5_9GAMM|nr:hypothetical protein [Pantoea sp. 3.5.1]KKD30166.1 hypothetical protein EP46_22255 [Pantoea sp. 3.5.1]
MARQQILLTRTFSIDGHQLTFTAIERGGVALVEYGVSTLSEAAPLLTLEKPRIDQYSACYYVENITDRAANKLLEYFRSEFAAVVGLVDRAFTRQETNTLSSRERLFSGK